MFYLRGKADDLSSLKKSNWEIPPVPAALWKSEPWEQPPSLLRTHDRLIWRDSMEAGSELVSTDKWMV